MPSFRTQSNTQEGFPAEDPANPPTQPTDSTSSRPSSSRPHPRSRSPHSIESASSPRESRVPSVHFATYAAYLSADNQQPALTHQFARVSLNDVAEREAERPSALSERPPTPYLTAARLAHTPPPAQVPSRFHLPRGVTDATTPYLPDGMTLSPLPDHIINEARRNRNPPNERISSQTPPRDISHLPVPGSPSPNHHYQPHHFRRVSHSFTPTPNPVLLSTIHQTRFPRPPSRYPHLRNPDNSASTSSSTTTTLPTRRVYPFVPVQHPSPSVYQPAPTPSPPLVPLPLPARSHLRRRRSPSPSSFVAALEMARWEHHSRRHQQRALQSEARLRAQAHIDAVIARADAQFETLWNNGETGAAMRLVDDVVREMWRGREADQEEEEEGETGEDQEQEQEQEQGQVQEGNGEEEDGQDGDDEEEEEEEESVSHENEAMMMVQGEERVYREGDEGYQAGDEGYQGGEQRADGMNWVWEVVYF
ncbi:hypothetical protein DM02DRAFT_729508 [Periconia macrospinosa]|uniref:Uncharacterized protein n=1 Tax=Periconia macrospinosa TaxID=97972 RepID=A0A2V1DLK3_9PLEO|nr:hypothetical protein DM02DRAFT_729508 [Periconia macrospinosa]